jgi:LuxR family maltose regulon positive regulatory protein
MLSQDRRVVLAAAPAGFGKSTLLAQWSRSTDRPVAWVNLDRADSDPMRFWAHIVAALDRVAPGSFAVPGSAFAFEAIDEIIEFVVNGLCHLTSGVVLVLDDYHEVRSARVDRSVEDLIAHFPAGSAVAIATRHDPDLALARWRAAEQLTEIRQRQFRFSEAEAAAWSRGRAFDLPPEKLSEALEATEGWPALFTLVMRSSQPAGLGDHRRHIAEYVREEVVRGHEDDEPPLILAAVCPRVCAPLLEHTLGTRDASSALERIARSGVLLERLDGAGKWYRLHRLVGDYLTMQHETDPKVRKWMVRAAAWYAANDHPREALELMLRANEHEAAAGMINRFWLQHMRIGQAETLRNDLARVDPEVAATSAPFLVTRAWLYAYQGRARDALADLRRAAAVATPGPLPDGSPSVEATAAVINSIYAIEGLPSVLPSAATADELVEATSTWRPLVDMGIGCSLFMTGDLVAAQSAFDRVLASRDGLLRANAIGWGTVIDVMLGNLSSARARFDDGARVWIEDPALTRLPQVVVAKAALACADGHPMEAAADLEECRIRLDDSDPCDQLEVSIWLADASARIGRSKRAQELLASAERILARLGGSDWYAGRIREVEERIVPNGAGSGRDPGLTQREERILQLLSATHLSQREIGRELGVSFNTIKSHVKAIYVKLGATSREEASQIARNLGLI